MSSGHHAHHLAAKFTPDELDDLLQEALADPRIKQRLAKPYNLVTTQDIAYLGSSSIGGANVYLDRHLPKALPVGRKKLNVVPALIRHERLEQALEDVFGWPYRIAHPVAQRWEEKDYRAKGFDPAAVEKAFEPFIKADGLERIERVPTDLDLRPEGAYADKGVIARVQAQAQKEKRSHESVGYVAKSQRPSQHCGKCAMFIEPKYGGPGCTGVQSPVAAAGWCRRFKLGEAK